ncbi:MAG: hypothetical protein IZT56_15300 [Bacteroidetes bacterium]|nr:hypothetical protein [Bacteroidota bacterium]
MKKFKLLALALAIGTGSIFAENLDKTPKGELDEAYEFEQLYDEAFEDPDFFSKLHQENQTHSREITCTTKNLNTAAIAYDNQGLEVFDAFLNDNYENYLNDNRINWDMSIKDDQSNQSIKMFAGVESYKCKE